MALVIIKTLARVRQRGANYFHCQPHHALIIRRKKLIIGTGNIVIRTWPNGRVRPARATRRGLDLFYKNTR